jgi:hypothetical protein
MGLSTVAASVPTSFTGFFLEVKAVKSGYSIMISYNIYGAHRTFDDEKFDQEWIG